MLLWNEVHKDTCGGLWSRFVSDDIVHTLNYLEMNISDLKHHFPMIIFCSELYEIQF